MKDRARRRFRPGLEGIEERCVATAHVASAALVLHELAAHHALARGMHGGPLSHLHVSPGPSLPSAGSGLVGTSGLIHLRLPGNFRDWGVVTLWNNATSPVTFTVSASTFNSGQFYPFTLPSGGNRSFFAPVVAGRAPLFQVSFLPNNANAIPLPQDNVVFESTSYVPAGTAGWPYAIGLGVNGPTIAQI